MTKFQAGTMHTSQVLDCQVYAIGKALRPLFADPLTYNLLVLYQMCTTFGLYVNVLYYIPIALQVIRNPLKCAFLFVCGFL